MERKKRSKNREFRDFLFKLIVDFTHLDAYLLSTSFTFSIDIDLLYRHLGT